MAGGHVAAETQAIRAARQRIACCQETIATPKRPAAGTPIASAASGRRATPEEVAALANPIPPNGGLTGHWSDETRHWVASQHK